MGEELFLPGEVIDDDKRIDDKVKKVVLLNEIYQLCIQRISSFSNDRSQVTELLRSLSEEKLFEFKKELIFNLDHVEPCKQTLQTVLFGKTTDSQTYLIFYTVLPGIKLALRELAKESANTIKPAEISLFSKLFS